MIVPHTWGTNIHCASTPAFFTMAAYLASSVRKKFFAKSLEETFMTLPISSHGTETGSGGSRSRDKT